MFHSRVLESCTDFLKNWEIPKTWELYPKIGKGYSGREGERERVERECVGKSGWGGRAA
jgi:hypothetical protein